jgi:hypothetical protein
MSENDSVFFLRRWRKRIDAVIRILSDPHWQRGEPLVFSVEEHREGTLGPFVIVVHKGTARADFCSFEDPHATIETIKKAIRYRSR